MGDKLRSIDEGLEAYFMQTRARENEVGRSIRKMAQFLCIVN